MNTRDADSDLRNSIKNCYLFIMVLMIKMPHSANGQMDPERLEPALIICGSYTRSRT